MSGIRKLFEAASADAVHLGIGEPHVQPPDHVIKAFIEAARQGKNRYSPTAGIPELRDAIAGEYEGRWPEPAVGNVAVTSGSTAALFAALFSIVQEGDEVLVPDPGFVLYRPHVQMCGASSVPYPTPHENGFQVDLDRLAEHITSDTKAIIVNSPSNPTGVTLDEATVDGIAELADEHDLWVISDEAYDAIVYDQPHASLLGKVDKLVYLNTFSKRYAMTGWRLGFALAPEALAEKIRIVAYHMYAAPQTPAQYAAVAAIDGPQDHVTRMVEDLRERRDLISDRLETIDRVDLVRPTGAFYAFPEVDVPETSMDLAMKLLDAGLVTAPGSAFGAMGEGHIRFSFATDPTTIDAGLQIFEKVLDEY